ncbi:WS/DGAT domain-containing protein [Parafrankia elaeagni]|uniref:WS/DGAT domain-containing protein n=1 Tax=Parafrankia elaeagni TaxID=222534 RepID=UPI0009FBA464|nr:WS/DGAT domain-containing protein [Parafrankia elaeagni]
MNKTQTFPLSAVDRALLDYQAAHPKMPVNVCTLLVSEESPPTLRELRDFVARRLEVFPEILRRRIVRLPGRRPRWGWVVDHAITADDLVRERGLPAGGGAGTGLRPVLRELVGTPVPVSALPWRLWLLHEPDTQGFAVLYRATHVHQDGAAKNLMISALFGADAAPFHLTGPRRWRPARRPAPRALGAAVLRGGRWLAPAPTTAALSGPAGGVVHSWASTSPLRLQAVAAASGATVNDVFLAAVAGVLRSWSSDDGVPSGDVVATMAVSTRRPAEQGLLGNYVAGARVVLPCSLESPARRLAVMPAHTARLKRGGQLGAGERLLFDTLPARLRQRVLTRGLDSRSAALSISNVLAPSGPLTVAGRSLRCAVPIPSLFARQRLAFHLGGTDSVVSVGTAASDSVRGSTDLAARWLAELAVLEAALGLAAGPERTAIPVARSGTHVPFRGGEATGAPPSAAALVRTDETGRHDHHDHDHHDHDHHDAGAAVATPPAAAELTGLGSSTVP